MLRFATGDSGLALSGLTLGLKVAPQAHRATVGMRFHISRLDLSPPHTKEPTIPMSKGHPPFKLQSVLNLRTQQAQACQMQLTQLQAQRTQLTDQLAQIRQQVQHVHDDSGQWSGGGGNQWLGYLQTLRTQEANLLHRIKAQDKAIDEQQQVLTQARIKEKTLDRLKETHHATCLTVQRYHEAAFLDEMASRSTSRL